VSPADAGRLDARSLDLLDFPVVRGRLAGLCGTPLGRRQAEALEPSPLRREVAVRLAETDEARALLDEGRLPPVGGVEDVGPQLARARRGGVLEGRDLLAVATVAAACRRLRAFFAALPEGAAPRLRDWAQRLHQFPRLEAEVARCLDEDGEVRDQASPRLADLRRQQRALQARIRERLDALLRSPAVQPHLQEPLVTQRGDRFVLPVRVDHRHQVPGIVHDQSASGATVFIEPTAVVEANNELRRLAAEERAEVERILAELSQAAGETQPEMSYCLDILGHLDLAVAKARLSERMDGRSPELDAESGFDLRRARHPLIEKPVPLDVRLGAAHAGFRALVVSGPNTGGKTVALKTAGLLVCMAQAGLHLPVAEGSRLGPVPQVFCDAGDEQGVAQNLSTFSSHMTRIVRFLAAVAPGGLVLLDELGAGTDPSEGAALGTALLERLLERGACVVATTHLSELIGFAYRHPEAENASVEFDPETLRPTYRLVIGLPGRSNALAIASRLGLDAGVVERARDLLRPGERHVERLLAGMVADERRIGEARAAAEDERREAQRLRSLAEESLRRAESRAAERLEAARREAADLLRSTREEADRIVRELRRRQAEADRDALAASETLRRELRERLESLPEAAPPQPAPGGPPPPGGWRAGMTVRVASLRQTGVLLEAPDAGGVAPVQIGSLRVAVRAADLAPAAPEPAAPAASPGFVRAGPFAPFHPECDLRGMTAAEATERVDRYLDEAVLAGCRRVRLVHGKGTGALRQAVAEFLRGHPQVEAFRVEPGSTEVDVRGL
jgi:DNA mismatch repair protein MutS2